MTCGVADLTGCVTGAVNAFLRGVVTDALNPMLELLSESLLTTPDPSQLPGLAELWQQSWDIVVAVYVLLVMAAGVLVMAFESVQARYSIREIAPRLVIGFLAGGLSLPLAGAAIGFANALSRALLAGGVNPDDATGALKELVAATLTDDGGLFLLLVAAVMAVVLLALLLVYLVRVAATVVLVAGAPLALMFHALPQTDGIARWWWRAFTGLLAVQVIQSLTLVTALRVFLTPGSFALLGGTTQAGLVRMLVTLALLYVLFKIPFWVLASTRIGGGRSLIGSLARGWLTYKTFGLLRGRSSGNRSAGSSASGGVDRVIAAAVAGRPTRRRPPSGAPCRTRTHGHAPRPAGSCCFPCPDLPADADPPAPRLVHRRRPARHPPLDLVVVADRGRRRAQVRRRGGAVAGSCRCRWRRGCGPSSGRSWAPMASTSFPSTSLADRLPTRHHPDRRLETLRRPARPRRPARRRPGPPPKVGRRGQPRHPAGPSSGAASCRCHSTPTRASGHCGRASTHCPSTA